MAEEQQQETTAPAAAPAMPMVTPAELAQRIRARYPGQYDQFPDQDLVTRYVAKHPEYAQIVRQPDFSTTNEKNAQGAVVDPNTIGTLARHAWEGFSPVGMGQLLPWPKKLGGSGLDNPLNPIPVLQQAQGLWQQGDRFGAAVKFLEAASIGGPLWSHIADQLGQVATQVKERWNRGDHFGAAVKLVEANIPIFGPQLSKSGNEIEQGKIAAGFGDAIGVGLNLATPQIVSGLGGLARAGVNRVMPRLPAMTPANPAEAAAVNFARERGIPLDAATATGNQFVSGVQGLAEGSLGGSFAASKARAAQQAGQARVGAELAEQVHPTPTTPELAGRALQESAQKLRDQFHEQANTAYGNVRDIQARPENLVEVPKKVTGAERRAWTERATSSLGGDQVTPAEMNELRRMRAEMENLPFVSRTWVDRTGDVGKAGNAAGGEADIVGGAAGASVYDDILKYKPGNSTMTRGEVTQQLGKAIDTGYFDDAAKGALQVARKRLVGSYDVTPPELPPEAGAEKLPTQQMAVPVDLRAAKELAKPIYQQLRREGQLVPLQGDKAKALTTLDRLMHGPDFAPLDEADAALGDLKAMARPSRPTGSPIRTQGQGIAASIVGPFEDAVQAAMSKAKSGGADMRALLTEGRAATKAKYQVNDLIDSLREEPVGAYRQATAPGDAAIEHLRMLQEAAPQAMPELGRAVLENMLTKATAEGGFQRGAALQADWARLGPNTKRILFGPVTPDLDKFFLLAKRISDLPNPSKSALTAAKGLEAVGMASAAVTNPLSIPFSVAEVYGTYKLTQLMHNQEFLRALNNGLEVQLQRGPVSAAARTAAAAAIAKAAAKAGAPLQQQKQP